MRVLITSPVFPPDLGGPAVYVPSIARFLMSRGHDVGVVAFCADSNPTGHAFPITAIPRGPLPIRYLKAFFAVWREAKKYDVVYVNEHLALLHVLAGKLAGKPVVIRIMVDGIWEISHRKGWIDGDDINTFETKDYGFKVKASRWLQKRWWGWCSRIISCSDFLRRIPIDRYGVPESKLKLIYNAYHGPEADSISETQAEARQQLELDPDQRYVLTICRLMVWKGVDGIIQALKGLPDDVHLLIAGDGDMEQEWTQLAADLGLAERVSFLGNVPHAQIPLLIRSANLFVLNSEYEGLSHTLLEVVHLGTPIVCTGVCGNPEVVEHEKNGLLVPMRDTEALRAAMDRVLSDPELAQRFVAESLRRAPIFSREQTFPQVEEVLEQVRR
ncbi:MAG: glycosyltransferase involved in cell wall biosynthesis [Planctomycetota bacterium]|jgi:glycosyltransferase involved in cell wall biosynthesis